MKVYNVLIINEINEIRTFDSLEKALKFKEEKVKEITECGYEIDEETENYLCAYDDEENYIIEIFENEIE